MNLYAVAFEAWISCFCSASLLVTIWDFHLLFALDAGNLHPVMFVQLTGVFVKEKVQDNTCGRKSVDKGMFYFTVQRSMAPFKLWIKYVDCVDGFAKETGNEAQLSSLDAVSKTNWSHKTFAAIRTHWWWMVLLIILCFVTSLYFISLARCTGIMCINGGGGYWT